MFKSGSARRSVMVLKFLCIMLVINLIIFVDITRAVRETGQPTDEEHSGPDSSPLPSINDKETPEPTSPVISPIPTAQPGSTDKPHTPGPSGEPVETSAPRPSKEPWETMSPEPSKPGDTGQPAETGDPDPEASKPVTQSDLSKIYKRKEEKVAYLTFDDGPTSKFTNKILDILAEENVKATFFLIGTQTEQYPDIVRRQYEEGHGIGNHTYSHVFKEVYKSPDNFIEELYRMESLIRSILNTDKKFRLVRFPGGSFGQELAPFRERVNDEGFVYVDWNCVNGDAETLDYQPPEKLISRLKETIRGQSSLVVLMHDSLGKQTTVEALPEIIRYLRSEGYRFALLPGSRGY